MTRSQRLIAIIALCAGYAAAPAASWRDATLPPAQRAELLNQELTLDERISLVHGIWSRPDRDTVLPVDALIAAGYVPGIPRLGIPALRETDASLGITNPLRLRPGDGGTAFPSSLALAATFSPVLAYRSGEALGNEARAKGFNVVLGPGVNLVRDPRNGRNFEYLGEDPLLAGAMGGENIRGIQSNHVVATIKHFALNDQETDRHWVNATIGEAALRESDLLAFQIGIERGHPGSVMCAYNRVNGPYACGSDFLLNQVLKGDWKYPGWVMSDWGAVYATDFAAKGLDQQSGEQADAQVWFGEPLKRAIAAGQVSEARLRDMTLRILSALFACGAFDDPVTTTTEIDYPAHRQLVQEVATDGMVLLRNRDSVLPLGPSATHILVIGGHADLGVLSGGGSSQVYEPNTDWRSAIRIGGEGRSGARRSMVFHSSSVVSAIRDRAGSATVTFYDGRYPSAAADLAGRADTVIVFATQWMSEAEDAPDMSLPEGQDALIAAVARANPRTVVVLETGGAVEMPWLNSVAAVLEAWYPGSGGANAIANVLFGKTSPSGRLPVTFPTSISQYPRPQMPGADRPEGDSVDSNHLEGALVGYRWMNSRGEQALFPFGFGLSFTEFRYDRMTLRGGRDLEVSFEVKNVGDTAGVEVPQVYLLSALGQPRLRLLAFERVSLAPGETVHLSLRVDRRLLGVYNPHARRWSIAGGAYRVGVGPDSATQWLVSDARLANSSLNP